MALSQGVQKKRKLWTAAGCPELEKLELLPYAAERRKQLLQSLDGLDAEIEQLNRRGEEGGRKRPGAGEVATHPGGGAATAVAMGPERGAAGRVGVGEASGDVVGS